ncbi:hypothetical protein RRF57_011600 [Xylaria bambusicola]|uniref:Uncharacterized protein n=1 Tax=Xylaria bambusicola TaxID=326684 RepID=A0AAN7ZE71_9PEZI
MAAIRLLAYTQKRKNRGNKESRARLTHIRESTGWKTHGCTAHERRRHDQQIRVWLFHRLSDIVDEWQEDKRCHRVADERSDHKCQT